MSLINEFRQDLVSGEWVLFATGRAKRPSAEIAPRVKPDLSQCPFEDPEASGNEVLVTYLPDPDIDVTVDAQGQETGNQGRNSGVATSAPGREVSGNKVTNLNPDIANQKLNQSWQSDYQKTVDGGTDFNKGAISALGRSVLVAPHVTEKAARLESVGQYVFRVHPAANQIQIRQAVETAYQVKVAGVQVVKIPAKTRRLGKHVGLKAGYKKAIVSLRPGDKIQLIAK